MSAKREDEDTKEVATPNIANGSLGSDQQLATPATLGEITGTLKDAHGKPQPNDAEIVIDKEPGN